MKFSKLNWCFSSLGCPEYDLEKTCQLARDYSIRHLELRVLENELDLPAYFQKKYGSAEAIQKLLDRHEIKLVALDTSLLGVKNSDEDKKKFLEFLPWAEALGGPRLRVMDGGTREGDLIPAELSAIVATLSWWSELKTKNRWKSEVMLETHNCLTTAASIEASLKSIRFQKPILWDTHHTWAVKHEDPFHTWSRIKDSVCHLHVKDGLGLNDQGKAQYTLFGQGRMPVEGLLEKVMGDGFQGPVSIEWEKKWIPELPSLEAALESARKLGWF
ncbi:MAG: sugar phosphate isomerase/epimerase [Spirochaetia bacterium]|nr:sugar phosphate isomerase/epimerase [Spirochaetia bacterium]